MVLLVHGGPWARDSWCYDREVQWLANRSYAVMQVNYRGSVGFGKAFARAGDREWAGKMHDDLIDAVNWSIGEGVADPARIAIYGASYGGYAALVGATFTPEVFCCSISVVGIANLETMRVMRQPLHSSYGLRRKAAASTCYPTADSSRATGSERINSPRSFVGSIVKRHLVTRSPFRLACDALRPARAGGKRSQGRPGKILSWCKAALA
jgi:pimeloyl-ACP methyl ester carboxylesterase